MIRIFIKSGVESRGPILGSSGLGVEVIETPAGHPIAFIEFLKGRSGVDMGIRDAERWLTLHYTPLKGRMPATNHMGPPLCSEAASGIPTNIGFG